MIALIAVLVVVGAYLVVVWPTADRRRRAKHAPFDAESRVESRTPLDDSRRHELPDVFEDLHSPDADP